MVVFPVLKGASSDGEPLLRCFRTFLEKLFKGVMESSYHDAHKRIHRFNLLLAILSWAGLLS